MHQQFSSDKLMFLKQSFNFFSTTQNYMSSSDINRLLKCIGKYLQPTQLVNLIEQVSDRKDGRVNLQEFTTLIKIVIEGEKQTELRKLYRKFDKDGNGSLSVPELKEIMQKTEYELSSQEIDTLLQSIGQEEVSFENFCKFILSNLQMDEESQIEDRIM